MLTRPRLAIDIPRRQPRAFVSHAHADHMARHETAFCTPHTAALYRHRLGAGRRVVAMRYDAPIAYHDAQLTALPAGHCLGSAMLHVDDGRRTLLYTGDFKLGDSLTAVAANPQPADIVVMESTFGSPAYRLPPREDVVGRLLALVRRVLERDRTPIVHAYALGKAQEVTALLAQQGVPVLQHPEVYAVTRVYQQCGVSFGPGPAMVGEYASGPLEGHAVVTLPRRVSRHRLAGLGAVESIAVTGWAAREGAARRLGVDHALPLSDHADYDELIEFVRRVQPERVLTTHGPAGFDERLRDLGFNAAPLAPDCQRRLF